MSNQLENMDKEIKQIISLNCTINAIFEAFNFIWLLFNIYILWIYEHRIVSCFCIISYLWPIALFFLHLYNCHEINVCMKNKCVHEGLIRALWLPYNVKRTGSSHVWPHRTIQTDCTFLPLRVVRPSNIYSYSIYSKLNWITVSSASSVSSPYTCKFLFYHHDRDCIFVEGIDSFFEYLLYIFHHADQVKLKAIYHI